MHVFRELKIAFGFQRTRMLVAVLLVMLWQFQLLLGLVVNSSVT
jgi:hypothetical protein